VADTPRALFERAGDEFHPTDLTRTGWSDDAQHGGPPAALLAKVIEDTPAQRRMRTTRITFDLLREVPLAPLTATTTVVKDGRRVQVVDAALFSGHVEVARARALRIRIGDVALPPSPEDDWDPPPPPGSLAPVTWPRWERGGDVVRFHRDAVEVRTVDNSFWSPGRGRSWLRLEYPVVAGEEPTPLTTIAALSDIANGNSMTIDPTVFLFVNPDITLYLHRPMRGEWLGMDGRALQNDEGIGLTDTVLFDQDGRIGRVNQSQLIERHR
jgi:hypothetical protein